MIRFRQKSWSAIGLTSAGLVAALLSAAAAQPRVHASASLLGIVGNSTSSSLVRLNPRTLRPLPGQRLALGPIATAWAYSPDRALLAVGVVSPESPLGPGCVDPQASFRFVDPATLRALGDLSLGTGYLYASAWLAPERLVAVLGHCDPTTLPELVVVDPSARRLLERRTLPSDLGWVRTAGTRLALLSANANAIAPARLTIVDGDGRARSVVLDRIEAGTNLASSNSPSGRSVSPGLALTPDGKEAFVVSPSGLVGKVDLGSLSVSYHELSSGRGLAASAKGSVDSSSRIAQVLPTGFLAIAGSEERTYIDSSGAEQSKYIRAGLALVDPNSWTANTVDPSADSFTLAGSRLLATGSIGRAITFTAGGTTTPLPTGSGLSAYTLYGVTRFHLFPRKDVLVDQSYGRRAYVYVNDWSSGSAPLRVVDLRSGKVVGERSLRTLPWILQGLSSTG